MALKQTKNPRIRPRAASSQGPVKCHSPTSSCCAFLWTSYIDQQSKGSPSTMMRWNSKSTSRRQRKSLLYNSYHFSWQKRLFLAIVYGATILLSVSALDFLEVDSSGEIVQQSERRERIAKNLQTLSDQQQYDRTIATENTYRDTYRVRPRIHLPTSEEKQNDDGRMDRIPTTRSNNKIPQREETLWKTVQLPQNEIHNDITQSINRNLQRKWVYQGDLPDAFSKSADSPNQHPSAFSNDRPTSDPNQHPSAFSDDHPTAEPSAKTIEPSAKPVGFTLPPFSLPTSTPPPSVGPTPGPTRFSLPPFTLPPFTLPPFTLSPIQTAKPRIPTESPTTIPSNSPTKAPTESPTFPEPAPIQEPDGGGDVDPPEPGGGGGLDPPEPDGNPDGTITEPGGDTDDDPTSEPTTSASIQPTSSPSSLPTTLSPTLYPTFFPTFNPTVEEPGGNEPGEPDGGGNEPGGEPGSEPGDEPGGGSNEPGDEPGGGSNEPGDEPGGDSNEPGDEPGGDSNEPGDEPGEDSNEPGDEPGGDSNEPGDEPGGDSNEPGGEPGGDSNAPGDEPGNEPGDEPGDEPGGGNSEPGDEPGGGGNQPGDEPGPTLPPTEIPSVMEEDPGEPGGGGNEPGDEPGGGDNQPGVEPEGGDDQPGEPNEGGNQPGGVEPNGGINQPEVEIPSVGGSEPGEPGGDNEPGEPATLLEKQGENEPIALTIAALNSADSYGSPPSNLKKGDHTGRPTQSNIGKVYSPGSPEWNKERISVAEVPPFALQFTIFSRTKDSQSSSDDTDVLEVLTAEHMLNYSKSILGSKLLSIDGLVLQSIDVHGNVTKQSRMLSEANEIPRFESMTKQFELESLQQQSFEFTFRAKFVFMHWTRITWALDLPGLAKNLAIASLSEDEVENYLATLQGVSSANNADGVVKDFLFASATDVLLVSLPETTVEENHEKKEQKVTFPFIKPQFPTLSILAFSSLGLAIVLCLLRWRIEKKRQTWLKTSFKKDRDDEITVIFSDSNEEMVMQNWLKTSDKNCKMRDNDDEEVTVVFSDLSDDGEESYLEQPQIKRLHHNLKWGLDYMIYGDVGKEDEVDDDDDDDDDAHRHSSTKSDQSTVVEEYESFTTRKKELKKSAQHASNSTLNSKRDTSRASSVRDQSTAFEAYESFTTRNKGSERFTQPVSNLTLDSKRDTSRARSVRDQSAAVEAYESFTTRNKGSERFTQPVSNLTLNSRVSSVRDQSAAVEAYERFTTRNKELEKSTQHASNLTLNSSKRDTSRGGSARDRSESFAGRRGGLDKATQHASNLTLTSRRNSRGNCLDKYGVWVDSSRDSGQSFTARRGTLEQTTQHISNLSLDSNRRKTTK